MAGKLCGGCFSECTNPELEKLNSSIDLDKRLYEEDVIGSQAYSAQLHAIGIITSSEEQAIRGGLETVKNEWSGRIFKIKEGDEDIHTANERRLKELIGEPATKLHTGRSRNDQVATDMRLWLRNATKELENALRKFVCVMIDRSEKEIDVLMPGYTHLQRAQPVRWSHWLLSHAWYFKTDVDRLTQLRSRVNVLPLGSGALAGNPFKINRELLAKEMGFEDVTQNSMQAVGDRDFIAEFLFWSSLTGVHLSRLAEDMIIYSTKEFNFLTVSDTYSTGSSLMPQKRNPDSLELVRGIGGGIFGHCCGFMMALKGLPSTYNKDLQSDKEFMFNSYDKLISVINVVTGTINTLQVNEDKCKQALNFDMLATDVAYYLVRKGVPFRSAHHIAGQVVALAEKTKTPIQNLTLEELKMISEHIESDITMLWNFETSVEQYQTVGGTSFSSVQQQINVLKNWLDNSN